ncbi:DUF2497 domain-containing protein [Bartonella ancashensis]|uniref:DUF2497 domain-containing protein n=1 Tax=Bartonella ancashensis TaxID=1318743 RepID=A0A0M4M3N6_9HYPH|nr:DUF2497 domain-containing protein [Bartonella ancashensis]ALE03662.1 hypothetical protein PU02_0848 [Bartonella ancashensis]
MVQSSGALREPSMDEILTSIREIIEENTVQSDQASGAENVLSDVTEKGSFGSYFEDGIYETSLSVDDAMKTLADRIGLPSDMEDLSFMQVEDKAEIENDMGAEGSMRELNEKKMESSPKEKSSVHKVGMYSNEVNVLQQEDIISHDVELSKHLVSSAEKVAEDILRPAVSEWLQDQLPILLEKILREEILKKVRNLS